jgi:uncharacterized membrane protein YphA (DoxX/SURF4 family)
MDRKNKINWKKLLLTTLRVAIGWHFLYEGITKLLAENWTAHPFLANASGFLSGFYHWLASSQALLKAVDILNIYGLILIGLALFMGLYVRFAAISGALLLTLYYFAHPPFGPSLFGPAEGHVFIVDKVFIEAFALLFIAFYRENGYGIDALRAVMLQRKTMGASEEGSMTDAEAKWNTRREVLKNLATLPLLGVMGWGAFNVRKKHGVDVMSGATIQVYSAALSELKGELPKGKIGQHEISKLVMGGNLIGGWSHARDLIYASSLFKAYNTEKKVYETLMLSENAGINSINVAFSSLPLINRYKKATGSKIKVIAQALANIKTEDLYSQIDQSIDLGADIIQVHGASCDNMARDGKVDLIGKMVDRIRSQGYTAGLASHETYSMVLCEENGIIPDYYMKTMHHDNYWSAHPRENRVPYEVVGRNSPDHNKYHDNIFCLFPDQAVDFVSRAKVPVMGFKVLAAGAIHPRDGFKWAFENGADFICVGMFDFQVVNDVNICIEILDNLKIRNREWFA